MDSKTDERIYSTPGMKVKDLLPRNILAASFDDTRHEGFDMSKADVIIS